MTPRSPATERGAAPNSASHTITDRDIHAASVVLGTWYMNKEKKITGRRLDPDDTDHLILLNRVNSTFQAYGADLIQVNQWFSDLDPYEREVLDDLRDIGVSIPDIIDYLRAPEDLNAEGRTIRSDMASNLRLREFEAQSKKMQSSGRSAAILAGSALILTVGAAVAAPIVLPAIAPALAPAITAALAPVAAYVPTVQAGALGLFHAAAGGGAVAFMVKAWNNWQKIRGGPPALGIGQASSFQDMPNSLGSLDYKKITDEYQAIPTADRYLLSHLSESEMRLFLSGSDSVRKHIITASPPSAWSKIQSRLDGLARGKKTIPARARRLGQVGYTLLTASWNRETSNGCIPDLDKRLESWRAAAQVNLSSRQEDLAPRFYTSSQNPSTNLSISPEAERIVNLEPKANALPREVRAQQILRTQENIYRRIDAPNGPTRRAQINLGQFGGFRIVGTSSMGMSSDTQDTSTDIPSRQPPNKKP